MCSQPFYGDYKLCKDMYILTSVIVRYSVQLVEAGDSSQGTGKRPGPAQYSVPTHFAFLLFLLLVFAFLMFAFETLELLNAQRLVQFVNVVQNIQHVIAADQRLCAVCREPGHIQSPHRSFVALSFPLSLNLRKQMYLGNRRKEFIWNSVIP